MGCILQYTTWFESMSLCFYSNAQRSSGSSVWTTSQVEYVSLVISWIDVSQIHITFEHAWVNYIFCPWEIFLYQIRTFSCSPWKEHQVFQMYFMVSSWGKKTLQRWLFRAGYQVQQRSHWRLNTREIRVWEKGCARLFHYLLPQLSKHSYRLRMKIWRP